MNAMSNGVSTEADVLRCGYRTIACNRAGGRVGFAINASRAAPLMRAVQHSDIRP